MLNIHTTCVSIKNRGILLLGAPASGKSDLALRLILHHQAILVSDDRTDIEIKSNKAYANTPQKIAGMIEVRGVGIQKMPYISGIEIKLAVELVKTYKEIERLPQEEFYEIEGIKIPLIKIYPFEASAPDKIVIKLDSMVD